MCKYWTNFNFFFLIIFFQGVECILAHKKIILSLRAFVFENKTWFWECSPHFPRLYYLYLDLYYWNYQHKASAVPASKWSIANTRHVSRNSIVWVFPSELLHSPVFWNWEYLISLKMINRYFNLLFVLNPSLVCMPAPMAISSQHS